MWRPMFNLVAILHSIHLEFCPNFCNYCIYPTSFRLHFTVILNTILNQLPMLFSIFHFHLNFIETIADSVSLVAWMDDHPSACDDILYCSEHFIRISMLIGRTQWYIPFNTLLFMQLFVGFFSVFGFEIWSWND